MVRRYFLSTLLIASILTVSCRQDDTDASPERVNINEFSSINSKENAGNETILGKGDTIVLSVTPSDPPKNGTHWKLLSDSIKISEDTDPPKNGTHWKSSN